MTGATRVLRVMSMCVVPGSTASWPCGRSRIASARVLDVDEVGVAEQDQYREVDAA